jgi:hypothetical protein
LDKGASGVSRFDAAAARNRLTRRGGTAWNRDSGDASIARLNPMSLTDLP